MIASHAIPQIDLPASLADHARVWIYQNKTEIDAELLPLINQDIQAFAKSWAAHGQPLDAKAMIYFNRFICFFVDEQKTGASGCSIDSSVHLLQDIERKYQLNLFDRMETAYVDRSGQIASAPLAQLAALKNSGAIDMHTFVFDNTIRTLAELRHRWITPIGESWHARWVAA